MSRARRRRAARRRPGQQAALAVAVICMSGGLPAAAARADGSTTTTPPPTSTDASPTALIGNAVAAPQQAPPVALPKLPAAPAAHAPATGIAGLEATGHAPVAAPKVAPSIGGGKSQAPTGTKVGVPNPTGLPYGSPAAEAAAAAAAAAKAAAEPTAATGLRAADGAPLAADPTLSLAPLGPVPIGLPNFFIENFAIPPFLIPIYQAAAIEYEVPWQVLGAINEIETDYGRNLSVSSAGAEGWMQLLPQTWQEYGVDGNGDGVKDPYNPADAIFTAARFLHAAGASENLPAAIFAYNNASWFVDSVTLRAKLIGGLPTDLLSSLTGLTDGLFPVHATARYADDVAEAGPGGDLGRTIRIYAKAGSPVIAVHDGVVTALGASPTLGRYVVLRDTYGNVYTYSQLGTVAHVYVAPLPQTASAAQINRSLVLPADPVPAASATAGHQAAVAAAPAPVAARAATAPGPSATKWTAPLARLAADGSAGLRRVVARAAAAAGGGRSPSLSDYLVETYGLTPSDVALHPLAVGSRVIAGAILGRVGVAQAGQAPHVGFQIRPAGLGSPLIDPKPILDGWKLLEATATYRAAKVNPFFGPGAVSPPVDQILLESKSELQQQVLTDPAITITPCERSAIAGGLIDQRVLARLEFLSLSGAKPSVTAVGCASAAAIAAFEKSGAAGSVTSSTGSGASAVTGLLVLGSTTSDPLIPRLLSLQGTVAPLSVLTPTPAAPAPSAVTATAGTPPTPAPASGAASPPVATVTGAQQVAAALTPGQWSAIVTRLEQIGNPSVAKRPSSASIRVDPRH